MRKMPYHYKIKSHCLVTTVGEAPVGLLLLNCGEVICKSEYRQEGRCECTIVSTGEAFYGEGNDAQCIPFELEYARAEEPVRKKS